jgi:hypothetical protein
MAAKCVVKFRVAKAAKDAILGTKQNRLPFPKALCSMPERHSFVRRGRRCVGRQHDSVGDGLAGLGRGVSGCRGMG